MRNLVEEVFEYKEEVIVDRSEFDVFEYDVVNHEIMLDDLLLQLRVVQSVYLVHSNAQNLLPHLRPINKSRQI